MNLLANIVLGVCGAALILVALLIVAFFGTPAVVLLAIVGLAIAAFVGFAANLDRRDPPPSRFPRERVGIDFDFPHENAPTPRQRLGA